MKKVFISGITGNMGSRYALICKRLGLKVYGADIISFSSQLQQCAEEYVDGIIIATPTYTHMDAINIFASIEGIPILCEKPIRKGKVQTSNHFNVRMVNQYKYMIDENKKGQTYYNYFKTGQDSLLWDCINIFGLAKGKLKIKNDSPIWDCMINGQKLNLADMDQAYIDMIEDWVKNPINNHKYIEKTHKRVFEAEMKALLK